MQNEINVAAIQFPVLCFAQSIVRVKQNPDELTTCTKVALRNKFFDNMLIVEMGGKGYKVKGAKKLRGVGPFWGYNIFLNQKVKVDLLFEGKPFQVSLDEVKERIFQSFKTRQGWSTRDDFEELRDRVKNAGSISEIAQLLL
jgi:hypothetical protein